MYPSDIMQDLTESLEQCMLDVSLVKEGVTLFPTRGTGLGYFEGLKTIVVRSILLSLDRDLLSLYGDQALFVDNRAQEASEILQSYGFISKRSKVNYFQRKVDWAGYQFTDGTFSKSRSYWTDLVGAFFQQFHWERKSALASLSARPEVDYRSYDRKLAFLYEKYYGFEFERAEALSHFEDCGILLSVEPKQGLTKKGIVSRLDSPAIIFEDDVLKECLDVTSVVASTAKRFQKRRIEVYKSTPEVPKYVVDYVYPRLDFHKSKPLGEFQGGAFPRWMDEKSLVLYGTHSGTISAGLKPDEIMTAVYTNYLATDPYRSLATGGYTIRTPYRTIRGAPAEVEGLGQLLRDSLLLDRKSVKRHDLPRDFSDLWDTVTHRYELNQFLYSLHPPEDIKRKPVSTISNRSRPRVKKKAKISSPVEEERRVEASNLFKEIQSRQDSLVISALPGIEAGYFSESEDSEEEDILGLLEDLELDLT